VSAGQLQPKGGLIAQADRLGQEVGGHLALWAAFISPRPCNDSCEKGSCYGALEIVGVIIIIIICHINPLTSTVVSVIKHPVPGGLSRHL